MVFMALLSRESNHPLSRVRLMPFCSPFGFEGLGGAYRFPRPQMTSSPSPGNSSRPSAALECFCSPAQRVIAD
jgi:hypothetical protein